MISYEHVEPVLRDGRIAWRQETRLAAFVSPAKGPLLRIELGAFGPILQAIAQWRQIYVRRGPPQDDHRVGPRLRRLLWEPLEGKVAGARTVIISPDGGLAMLPFAALPGRAEGSFLLEDYAIAVMPTLQWLVEFPSPSAISVRPPVPGSQEPDSPGLLLVGDVDFGKRPPARATETVAKAAFPPLPGTRDEIEGIQKLYQETYGDHRLSVLRRANAGKAAVGGNAVDKCFLHFATHGFLGSLGSPADLVPLADEAMLGSPSGGVFDLTSELNLPTGATVGSLVHPGYLAGVALSGANLVASDSSRTSDGLLTAAEVSAWDLHKVQMAVLSACQSAVGTVQEGEGMMGLHAPFTRLARGRWWPACGAWMIRQPKP